ncbi:Minor extracellular protease vpr OS=Bacillus subtilis (strain 168) GN=vpr PE=1 SV=1 [Rhizoctonia solani AG-1 IB]|uniref:Minor extracellular protease vpr n=1 Tax=Thanatephorus cucumeris (strain AG1-IB / isolate 7/3/14) TaxID=1108050 RepID=A0A0B7FBD8_THACB|nr:Minor extracellular protease vpr OS=Bacillus subtilis (strain 168) GN=vpr PE=1 SV=1 [Rhizoctonia solani AG-1 IB]
MRFAIPCVVAAGLVSAAVGNRPINRASARTVPRVYLVELSRDSHLKRGFASPHEALNHDLGRRNVKWETLRQYSDNILTGAAVRLASDDDLTKLAGATGVQSISPVYVHRSPRPVFRQMMQAAPNETVANGPPSTHVMTGVDKLHAEGYFGQGIRIGIIDSGIDYTHPSLGGAIGPGNKVIGGYDFVGDAFTGLQDSVPIPDPDPLDQCNGHGTHVAGIVGANSNNPWNISGVAHQSEINAYRIFGCDGFTSDDIVIAALLRAHADGNDVINLSLGEPNGWAESLVSVVASRIAREGRIVTTAAGNDGEYGAWYISSPATGLDVISVGSIDNSILYQQNATVSNGRNIPYQSFEAIGIPGGLQLYATSSDVNATADACEPLPPNTPDLTNRLVIIRRGTCAFLTKVNNTAARGGRYFLVYNNIDEPLGPISTGNYPGALISQADGIFLVQQAIPQNLTVSFPNVSYIISSPTSGLVSPFSSYGPSYDMYLKPAIAAPGGNIPSTWPVKMGSWALASGTSMASPFVAGAAALLFQIHGKNATTSQIARSVFQNTAMPVMHTVNVSLAPTTGQQGAGLVNVYDAIKATGSLLPAEMLLNDTAHFQGTHTLVVNNGGTQDVTYRLSHLPAGTINTISGIQPNAIDLVDNSATVTIEPTELVVPAGSSASVNVTISPPTNLDASQFPVYSGYVRATGSDNSTLQSTYIGVAASLKGMKVIDNTNAYFGDVQVPAVADALGNPVPPNGSATFRMNALDFPIVVFRLVAGSPLVRFDLIDSQQSPTTNQRRIRHEDERHETGPATTPSKRSTSSWLFTKRFQATGTFDAVPILGILSQERYIARSNAATTPEEGGYYAVAISQYGNGTAIPNGSYRILLRALKITGSPDQEEDYETWTSPTIIVNRG